MKIACERILAWQTGGRLGLCTARYESKRLLLVCFEGLARLSRRVWRRFVRGSREISLVPSLHRASTDALIMLHVL